MHYATCQSLARRSDLDKLNDMVVAMIEQFEEVEDLWSEVARTAREQGPDDPRDGTLLNDWANVVTIKRVVDRTLAAIDQYTFPDASTEKTDESP